MGAEAASAFPGVGVGVGECFSCADIATPVWRDGADELIVDVDDGASVVNFVEEAWAAAEFNAENIIITVPKNNSATTLLRFFLLNHLPIKAPKNKKLETFNQGLKSLQGSESLYLPSECITLSKVPQALSINLR